MPITSLPTPPSRADSSTFATRADAFLGALPTFATEANTLQTEVNAKEATAVSAAATATTQAGIATSAASTATTKAAEATTARNEAVTLTESYQGSLASDPTLDKTGGALTAGDWYINSSTGFIRVYNGSAWVQGISAVSGVSSVNGNTGAVTGIATLAGSETLTNKTITSPVVTGAVLNDGYTEEIFAVTGATPALSPTNGSIQTWTLSANSTPTAGTWAAGQSIILGVTASTYTVTWPSVVWSKVGGSGAAPTLTSTGVNWMILWKVGTTIYGSFMGTT